MYIHVCVLIYFISLYIPIIHYYCKEMCNIRNDAMKKRKKTTLKKKIVHIYNFTTESASDNSNCNNSIF
jgi:hypothetical protein